ncbi:MAG: Fic family protein [Candidatus Micrarchaeota archaeon]|nr:Fic family protein [Candidatus Micrarchaeota archaeon]MDE1848033.1 Fic family protein [Candidatus Micrarchaeota archaeon]MDE1864736.1 Fic family protein [Candidatus Micrarchaeota archaeon]
MPFIKKVERGRRTYYYLEHSLREGKRVYKKRVYLGVSVPSNITVMKSELVEGLYEKRWYVNFSKIKKSYGRTLAKTPVIVRRRNLEAFMVRFTYDTQRIEGSKLSFPDTAKLLIDRKTPKDAAINDVKEAELHKEVFYEILSQKEDLSLEGVLQWHKKLFADTKMEVAGKIRDYPVLINRTDFLPPRPERLDDLLEDFFSWYNRAKDEINPVKLAALVHLKFVSIHPFGDGNGRISRLMMNFVLHRMDYPMMDIKYVDRFGYYRALKRSGLEGGEHVFIEWFFKKYEEANKDYFSY